MFICVLLGFIVVGIVLGLFHKLGSSIARLIIAVVSAVLAFTLCSTLVQLVPDIEQILGKELVTPLLDKLADAPVLCNYVTSLVSVALAPILFVAAYLIIKIVLDIIELVANAIVHIIVGNKKLSLGARLAGMGLGALTAVITCFCVLAPVGGYLQVADACQNGTYAGKLLQENEVVAEVTEMIPEIPFSDVALEKLATNETVSLKVEAPALVESALAFTQNKNMSFAQYTDETHETLLYIIGQVATSKGLTAAVADTVCRASSAWLEDKNYMGFTLPKGDEMTTAAIQEVLAVLATSTSDTVCEDSKTFLSVYKELYDCGALEKDADVVECVTKDNSLNRMLELLGRNPHTKPLVPAFVKLGVKEVVEQEGQQIIEIGKGTEDFAQKVADYYNKNCDADGKIALAALEQIELEENLTIVFRGATYKFSKAEISVLATALGIELSDLPTGHITPAQVLEIAKKYGLEQYLK